MAEEAAEGKKRLDDAKSPAEEKKRRRRTRAVGAAVLVIFLLSCASLLYRFLYQEQPKETVVSDIGMIDRVKVMQAHPSYETLQQLRSDRDALYTELKTEQQEDWSIPPPQIAPEPFDDSVWQKNAQSVVEARVALERERKDLAAKYRAAHDADYEKARDVIENEFANAILNINLKIDNQMAMHHPWDDPNDIKAEREAWIAERERLCEERERRKDELSRAYEKEIKDYADSTLAPKIAEWEQKTHTSLDKERAEALLQKSEAEARNTRAMDTSANKQDAAALRRAKKELLWQKEQQIKALEARIENDIRACATKLAILHHLTLIVTAPAERPKTALPGYDAAVPDLSSDQFSPVVTEGAQDLTEELQAEVQDLDPVPTNVWENIQGEAPSYDPFPDPSESEKPEESTALKKEDGAGTGADATQD